MNLYTVTEWKLKSSAQYDCTESCHLLQWSGSFLAWKDYCEHVLPAGKWNSLTHWPTFFCWSHLTDFYQHTYTQVSVLEILGLFYNTDILLILWEKWLFTKWTEAYSMDKGYWLKIFSSLFSSFRHWIFHAHYCWCHDIIFCLKPLAQKYQVAYSVRC